MTAPLIDADYANIRALVHRQLGRERRRRGAFRLAAAAAIVLLLARPRDEVTFPTARPAGVPPAAAERPAPPDFALAVAASPAGETPAGRRRDARRPAQPAKKEEKQPLRIEIETTDPDVRIIWIVNPTNTEEAS